MNIVAKCELCANCFSFMWKRKFKLGCHTKSLRNIDNGFHWQCRGSTPLSVWCQTREAQ